MTLAAHTPLGTGQGLSSAVLPAGGCHEPLAVWKPLLSANNCFHVFVPKTGKKSELV